MVTMPLSLLLLIIGIGFGSLCTEVLSTCSNERRNTYACVDIASDSICIEYRGNGSYLNYTSDIDIMESHFIDYIESNFTSELCRDSLMIAVCATIYPRCLESGVVQQLCSQQCEYILHDMCIEETQDVVEYINARMGNPVNNFTLNCSNSLNFAELHLESSVCYDNDCLSVSIVDDDSDNNTDDDASVSTTTMTQLPVTNMCIQLDAFTNAACRRFNQASQNVILNYTTEEQFSNYIETTNMLEQLLLSTPLEEVCQQAIGYIVCSYVFIPCNLTTGNPRPICSASCNRYFNIRCVTEFEDVLEVSSRFINYPFMNNCLNTLSHLQDFGLPLMSDDFADDCIDLIAIIEPGIESGVNNNTSSEESSSNNSTLLIVISIACSLLAIGIVSFLVVFLIIRQKRKTSKYSRSDMMPSKEVFSQHSVQSVDNRGNSECITKQVADGHATLTAGDLQVLRKEFGDDFTELLLPGNQVNLIEVLGEGEFGRVFKGTWTHHNHVDGTEISEEVAVKTIKNYNSLEKLKSFIRESAVMKNFHHPNVLQVLGISLETEDGLPYIVLPFMANGDLRKFLKNKRPEALAVDRFPEDLNEDKLILMCYQIASGMHYLAQKRIVHRDLAARNCMVDDKMNVRVADFGLARDVYVTDYYRQQSTGKIPIKWMAPETLNDRISNEKTDVWSYGITCWEIFSLGRTPYPTIPNHEIPEYVEAGNKPRKPQLCPDSMYSMMLKCWEVDAKRRLCFGEIIAELKNLDDGYVFDHLSVSDDGYVIDDPNDDVGHTTALNDDYVNPILDTGNTPNVDLAITPDDDGYVNA